MALPERLQPVMSLGPPACRVIAKGQVAEQGTHESLAEAGGLYSGLVRPACFSASLGTQSHCRCAPLLLEAKTASMLVSADCDATHPAHALPLYGTRKTQCQAMIAGQETVQQDSIFSQPGSIGKRLICQSAIIEHPGTCGRFFTSKHCRERSSVGFLRMGSF